MFDEYSELLLNYCVDRKNVQHLILFQLYNTQQIVIFWYCTAFLQWLLSCYRMQQIWATEHIFRYVTSSLLIAFTSVIQVFVSQKYEQVQRHSWHHQGQARNEAKSTGWVHCFKCWVSAALNTPINTLHFPVQRPEHEKCNLFKSNQFYLPQKENKYNNGWDMTGTQGQQTVPLSVTIHRMQQK